MRQFEKWKSENCARSIKLCSHAEASCNGCETMWREALKWVNNLLEKGDDSWTEGVLSGIQKSIKEELGNE